MGQDSNYWNESKIWDLGKYVLSKILKAYSPKKRPKDMRLER